MNLDLDIQFALEEEADEALPSATELRRWASAAFAAVPGGFSNAPQMTLRIVSEAEITHLNTYYRHKPLATNVLSFPFQAPPGLPPEAVPPALGDVVICAAVVAREARQQQKSPASHWAHMVVHGTLHLLGYDHMNDAEAQEMEALEAQILARLGYPDPYQAERPSSEAS